MMMSGGFLSAPSSPIPFDVEIIDATPKLTFTDNTAAEDDFNIRADGSTLTFSNATDSIDFIKFEAANTVTTAQAWSFPGVVTFSEATTPIKVDIIAERTGAAGVTVDGMLIKDGAITESVITDGTVLARVAGTETITGAWTFSHATTPILTDIIVERTAASGVTIDGMLIKDGAILEAVITDGTILARVAAAETISAAWTFTAGPNLRDSVLRIQDEADTTKQLAFSVGGITTATTRTITVPDKDLTVGGVNTTETISAVHTFTSDPVFNANAIPETAIADGAVFPRLAGTETVSGAYTFSHATTPILTDIIVERTAATGVTVDGMLIKDGAITESVITDGAILARVASAETISGAYTFSHATTPILTDIIVERTATAGVTIDGLLVKDSGIPQAAVTAHEAALTIAETQITDGALLGRVAAAETVSGAWIFSNVAGVTTDTLTERSVAAGVTVDGMLIKDGAIAESVITDGAILARVAGTETISGAYTFTNAAGVTISVAGASLLFVQPANVDFDITTSGDDIVFRDTTNSRFLLHTQGTSLGVGGHGTSFASNYSVVRVPLSLEIGGATAKLSFIDNTASEDDFTLDADASVFSFKNSTDAITFITFNLANDMSFGSAIRYKTTSITGATTLDATHEVVLADATTAAFTVTLPASSGITGRRYVVVKTDSSANAVTLDGNAAETINGAATLALAAQYDRAEIVSDGTNWIRVD